jgi:hypothetical protein
MIAMYKYTSELRADELGTKVRVIVVGRRGTKNLKDIWPSSSGLRDRRRLPCSQPVI